MAWRFIALVAAGCGRIGFTSGATGDASDASDGASIDAPPCGPLVAMNDNFDDGVIDTAKWIANVNPGLTVSETGGDLLITLTTATGFNYVTYHAVDGYALGTCTARITVVEAPSATPGAESAFCLATMAATPSQLCFDISGGVLSSYFKMGTVTDYVSVMFDPVMHAHLRFSQDATNVIWETSSDGVGWSVFDARPPPLDLSQIHVEVFAGTFMSVANPGQARFDDLIIE